MKMSTIIPLCLPNLQIIAPTFEASGHQSLLPDQEMTIVVDVYLPLDFG